MAKREPSGGSLLEGLAYRCSPKCPPPTWPCRFPLNPSTVVPVWHPSLWPPEPPWGQAMDRRALESPTPWLALLPILSLQMAPPTPPLEVVRFP